MAQVPPRLTPAPLPRGVEIYDRPAKRFGAAHLALAAVAAAAASVMAWLLFRGG